MDMRRRALLVFVSTTFALLACHARPAVTTARPTAPATSAPMASTSASASALASASTAPPAPPCVPKRAADADVVHVEASGDQAVVCFGADCVRVDPRTGAVAEPSRRVGPPDEVADAGAFTAAAQALAVEVCPRAGGTPCKRVATPSDPLGVAVSDDGARAFAFIAEAKPGSVVPWRLFGEVYDTASGRRLARTQLSSTMAYTSSENVYFASFVGPSLLLRDETPDRTAGIMGLWDGRLTRAAAWLGPGAFVKLDGATWASATRESVTFVDVVKVAELGALANPAPNGGGPARAGLLVMGDRVLWAWSSPPGVLTFDRKTHAAGPPHALAVCP